MPQARRLFLPAALVILSFCSRQANSADEGKALRFAVIGDSGSGAPAQYEIGKRLADSRASFPFTMVIMLGDNLYGGEKPRDFEKKFEQPYKALLDAGVKFYASLGNHDQPDEVKYKLFNMDGKRYYTFRQQGVRFFALDSNYMDRPQLEWLEKELAKAENEDGWKIAFFHHPLYSSGEKHGPSVELRKVLEPLFIKYGVNAVFSGHEHFYERVKPQNGIYYFIDGSSGKLRKGNIEKTDITGKGYDRDETFMLVEIAGDQMTFRTISRTGDVVDEGTLNRLKPSGQIQSSR